MTMPIPSMDALERFSSRPAPQPAPTTKDASMDALEAFELVAYSAPLEH